VADHTFSEFDQLIGQLATQAQHAIQHAESLQELESVRNKYAARDTGELSAFQKRVPSFQGDEKKQAGQRFNAVKTQVETWLTERQETLRAAAQATAPRADLTLPARRQWTGSKHPVTLVIDEIIDIFRILGFTVATGPEAETDWYNFGALNFPPNHPAMDAHDTIYLSDSVLLRTHTSPVQIRTMETYQPPIRVLIPGNVYRLDPFDASHAPMFAQVEGLAVDEDVSFVDLKATLSRFAREFFGSAKTRFRPSYFPFTEPSAEMDVECQLCKGAGCAGCKGTGWCIPTCCAPPAWTPNDIPDGHSAWGRAGSRCSGTVSPTFAFCMTPMFAFWSKSHDERLVCLAERLHGVRLYARAAA
jgi:phenylalanyl-tRNA synthetase alpha chain